MVYKTLMLKNNKLATMDIGGNRLNIYANNPATGDEFITTIPDVAFNRLFEPVPDEQSPADDLGDCELCLEQRGLESPADVRGVIVDELRKWFEVGNASEECIAELADTIADALEGKK